MTFQKDKSTKFKNKEARNNLSNPLDKIDEIFDTQLNSLEETYNYLKSNV